MAEDVLGSGDDLIEGNPEFDSALPVEMYGMGIGGDAGIDPDADLNLGAFRIRPPGRAAPAPPGTRR